MAKGGNPAEDRATRRQGVTVRELCERYWNAAEKGLILGKGGGPKKPGTLYRDKSRVDRHILPLARHTQGRGPDAGGCYPVHA